MATITWRSVAAPDATGAAQILQQAGQNINQGINQARGLVDNKIAAIEDQNISSLAQQIMGAGEGYEGLANLSQIDSVLQGVNAADVGGFDGLNQVMGIANQRRTQLESEATDAFNVALTKAKETGDFSEVNQQKDVFSSLVRNSSQTLEAARSTEATFNANQLIQKLNNGETTPESIFEDPNFNTQQPEYAAVFEAAARRRDGETSGAALRLTQQLLPQVQQGILRPAEAMDRINKLFKDDFELAKNSQLIGGLMNQFMEADARASNLTPEETLYFEQARSVINQQEDLFRQQEQVIKNQLMREKGLDSAAITIRDQVRDGNLSLTSIIQNAYPDADDGDRKDIREELLAVATGYSAEAVAYAINTHPEINDLIFTNRSALKNILDQAETKMKSVNSAYAEFDTKMVTERKRFNQWQLDATKGLIDQKNQMVINRRQGVGSTGLNVPQFEMSRQLISLMNGDTGSGGGKPQTGGTEPSVTDAARNITRNTGDTVLGMPRNVAESGFFGRDIVNNAILNAGASLRNLSEKGRVEINSWINDFNKKDEAMAERKLQEIAERERIRQQRKNQE